MIDAGQMTLEIEKEHQPSGQTIAGKSDEATRGRSLQVVSPALKVPLQALISIAGQPIPAGSDGS